MTPEREALVRAAWSRVIHEPRYLLYRDGRPFQMVITELKPIIPSSANALAAENATFETVWVDIYWNNRHTHWAMICEGLCLETGAFGVL